MAQPNATNKIHMTAKPAVVKIYAGYIGEFVNKRGQSDRVPLIGSGSGFIINPSGYVLTNAHVVSDVRDGDEEAKKKVSNALILRVLRANNLPVNDQNVRKAIAFLGNEGYRLTNLRRIALVFLQSGKSYPFEIKSYGAPTGEGKDLESGKDVSVLKIEIRNAPTLRLGVSDKVAVGDHVWVMGYPGAADSEHLDAQSELEPTTNDGSISARKATRDGTPVLQTNTNTTHGNSGGPVLNANGEVIGLLTFRGNTVGGQEVQGFNFIVPIDTANEFVRQGGTDNKPGAVDEKWKNGLDHYWKQEYSAAQKDFSEISALFPDHRESVRLVSDCQEHIAKGEDKTGKAEAVKPGNGSGGGAALAVVLLVGFGLIVLVGGGGAGLFFALRKKPAPRPFVAGLGYAPHGPPANGFAAGYQQPPQPPQPPQRPQHAYSPPPPPPAGSNGVAFAPTAFVPAMSKLANGVGTQMFQPTPEASIRWVRGPLSGQFTPVGQGIVIGREAGAAQLVIADPQISSAHAWIGLRGTSLVFVDRGSTNGSLVNDMQVTPRQEVVLKSGDVVALGKRGNVAFQVQVQ